MRGLLTSPLAKGALGGIVGVIVALLAWHLYTDHVGFHKIVDYLNTNAVKINKLP